MTRMSVSVVLGIFFGFMLVLAACEPTIKLAPSAEPITINLNIKLDAEVRIKLERTAKTDISKNPEIF